MTNDKQLQITPQPGRQIQFLSSPADICIYGGAAGGGKTWGLLLEPLRHVHNPEYEAIIFRRIRKQITGAGGMWGQSEEIYPLLGAVPLTSKLLWRFPSGATIQFCYMEYEKDKLSYKGAQVPLIGWDQLEDMSEGQFFYLLSRNRSTCGVRPYVRATCNPDPDSWLAAFLSWWIADDGFASLERAGQLRWFVRNNGQIEWSDSARELIERFGPDSVPMSVSFIPASVYDNPILLEKDPEYIGRLKALDLVDQERLLGDRQRGGNWKVRESAGKLFNRDWFEIVDIVPEHGKICRYWDLAASERDLRGPEPSATASVKMMRSNATIFILDCIEVYRSEVDSLVRRTAEQDGRPCMVRWEIEPGSAGIRESRRMIGMLAGFDARGERPTGDKVTRAKPLAAQAHAGHVKLLRGPWNEKWLQHMHLQPDIKQKDIMDASSGAFNSLARMGGVIRG